MIELDDPDLTKAQKGLNNANKKYRRDLANRRMQVFRWLTDLANPRMMAPS